MNAGRKWSWLLVPRYGMLGDLLMEGRLGGIAYVTEKNSSEGIIPKRKNSIIHIFSVIPALDADTPLAPSRSMTPLRLPRLPQCSQLLVIGRYWLAAARYNSLGNIGRCRYLKF